MIKLRSITFNNHPILGNLHLDFTVNGNPVDTIIFAGENGVGKSTILKMLSELSGNNDKILEFISEFELDKDGEYDKCRIARNQSKSLYFNSTNYGSYFTYRKKKINYSRSSQFIPTSL